MSKFLEKNLEIKSSTMVVKNAEKNTEFTKLGVSKEIDMAIDESGFNTPTEIQRNSIPLLLKGSDVIGISKTGSGKTLAFVIPALEKIEAFSQNVGALVLCPTRELAIQIFNEIKKFSKYKRGVRTIALYGGQNIEKQINYLATPKNIVVGTPGRILDLLNRKKLNLKNTKFVVLDEADEMLKMGFREDIESIIANTSSKRQTVLFSATMSSEIMEITKKFQDTPELIKSESKSLTVSTVEQYYLDVPPFYDKVDVLCNFLCSYDPSLSIIFCNTKKGVEELTTEMQSRGFLAYSIHGDMKQYERTKIMSLFKEGKIKTLVATDVVARGIDVDGVEVVFNFEIPQNEEYYVHRIGRTGRAGKSGVAFTLITGKKQFFALRSIENYIKRRIEKKNLPSHDEMYEEKQKRIVERVKSSINENNLEHYKNIVKEMLTEDTEALEIAAALLKLNYKELAPSKPKPTIYKKENVKFRVNLGKKNEITASNILYAISVKTGIPGKNIGKITLFDNYSFFEVPKEFVKKISSTSNCEIKGLYTKISLVD